MKLKNLSYIHKGALIGMSFGLIIGLTINLFPPELSKITIVLSSIFWGFVLGTTIGFVIDKFKK